MLHTHSAIYRRGLELRALLNNAFQRMHKHNCTVQPNNKFVKYTYIMDKAFDQDNKIQFFYKVATNFSDFF